MSAGRHAPFGRILGERSEEVPLPPGHEQLEREELARLFGHMVRARIYAIPLVVVLVASLVAVDPTPWRRAVLAFAGTAIPVFFLVERGRFARSGFTAGAIPVNLAIAAFGISTLVFATGGLSSPLLALMVPIAVLSGLFVQSPWHAVVPAVKLTALLGMWLVERYELLPAYQPAVFGGGTPMRGTVAGLLTAVAILAVTGVGRVTRATLARRIARTLHAQQESLRAHAERAEELTALSAEIAHELKNPLASVKGLAALLARDTGEPGGIGPAVTPVPGGTPSQAGKATERLAVLRREVDRMQSVLDGFLNFSRPLVPLALGECDVSALCREVAALHEGMGRERGVEISADAGRVQARCDPRKVKQVLLNLVQNALDASPRGAAVTLEAESTAGGGARLRVLDRGRGLDPELADAVWQPGVTTKSTGSGLGLTIARALARQHGGDLVLRPREGGGTVAEMFLPGGTPAPTPSLEGRAA